MGEGIGFADAVRLIPSGVSARLDNRTDGFAPGRRLSRILTGLEILFFQFAQAFFFLLFFLGYIFLALFILIVGFCQFVVLLEGIPD